MKKNYRTKKYHINIYKKLSKKFLIENYITKKMPIYKVGEIIGVSAPVIRKSLLNYNISIRTMSEALQNHICTKETKLKISNSHLGKKRPPFTKEWLNKMRISRRKRIGKYAPFYKDGRTPFIVDLYNILKAKEWRKQVFERDHFICQECSKKNCYLEAHHKRKILLILKDFLKLYLELNIIKDKRQLISLAITYKPFWDVDNGITLCKKCHNRYHKNKEENK